MTRAEMEMVTDGIVSTTKAAIAPLQARIRELAARIVTLESAPKSLDYQGTFQRAAAYRRNQAVTHKSAIWVCVTEQVRGVEPGTSPDCWQLAQKDAR